MLCAHSVLTGVLAADNPALVSSLVRPGNGVSVSDHSVVLSAVTANIHSPVAIPELAVFWGPRAVGLTRSYPLHVVRFAVTRSPSVRLAAPVRTLWSLTLITPRLNGSHRPSRAMLTLMGDAESCPLKTGNILTIGKRAGCIVFVHTQVYHNYFVVNWNKVNF